MEKTLETIFTSLERKIITRLEKKGYTVEHAVRNSDKEGDVQILGKFTYFVPNFMAEPRTGNYSATLTLAAIKDLTNWTRRDIAEMSDYPEMVMKGDWSGIRDSEYKAIQQIFDYCFKR